MKLIKKILLFPRKLEILLIRFYQKYITIHTPKVCKFYPTCSEYSKQAYIKFGFFKGTYLTIKRLK